MRKPKILVVGSCCTDFTFAGKIIPTEGSTVLGESFSTAPGGKGANQAYQAARLGADVTFVGKFGRDSFGENLNKVLQDVGIDTSRMLYSDTAPTASACIMLELTEEGAKNRIMVVPGSQMTFTAEDVAFLKDEIRNYDMLILQLEINMEINELVAAYAYEAGVPVMLNCAPSAPLSDEFLSHITYLSPNEHEARDLTGIAIHSLDDAKAAARNLLDRKVGNVLITMGSEGAVFADCGQFLHRSCVPTAAVDPTAAGDSFIGAFCTAIGTGMPAGDAMVFANHTASITVSRKGAMPSLPALDEVLALMEKTGAAVDISPLSCLK